MAHFLEYYRVFTEAAGHPSRQGGRTPFGCEPAANSLPISTAKTSYLAWNLMNLPLWLVCHVVVRGRFEFPRWSSVVAPTRPSGQSGQVFGPIPAPVGSNHGRSWCGQGHLLAQRLPAPSAGCILVRAECGPAFSICRWRTSGGFRATAALPVPPALTGKPYPNGMRARGDRYAIDDGQILMRNPFGENDLRHSIRPHYGWWQPPPTSQRMSIHYPWLRSSSSDRDH